MAELICIAFDGVRTADRVLGELQVMQQDRLLELADACVVVRDDAGRVLLKQSVNLVAGGALGGGALGVVCGSLVGVLFANPAAGGLVGAGIGAATGAISGALSDYGIDDDFIRRLGGTIRPRSSALFILLGRVDTDKLLPRLARYRGTVLQTSLDDGRARRLRPAA